jgi:hypothetical protein
VPRSGMMAVTFHRSKFGAIDGLSIEKYLAEVLCSNGIKRNDGYISSFSLHHRHLFPLGFYISANSGEIEDRIVSGCFFIDESYREQA